MSGTNERVSKTKKIWWKGAMEYYSALNKKEILTYVPMWVNLEDI